MTPTQVNLGVIVRTCGRSPLFLRRALASIVGQSVRPSLVVVVDDGDDAPGVESELAKFDWQGIVWRHQPRVAPALRNRSAALNRGIAAADTQWIAFLDDDDTWLPDFLERVAPLLAQHEHLVDFGGVVVQTLAVQERHSPEGWVETGRKRFNPDLRTVELAALVGGNQFTINALVAKRGVFTVAGPYREDLPVLEDWEFNVRAAMKFHFEVIPEPLVCYHLRPENDGAANTSIDEHVRTGARIRNEWLRADLAAGRIGLGQLAATGELRERLKEVRGFVGVLGFIRRWRDKLFGGPDQVK